MKTRTPKKWQNHEPFIAKRLFTERLAHDVQEFNTPSSLPELNLEKGEGLFLYGEVGTGKTVLAAQFVLDLYKKWWMVADPKLQWDINFVSAPRIFREIKTTFEKEYQISATERLTEDKVISKYEKADFLILDDLGMQGKTTDWLIDILFMIIDYRYEHLKPTIITSNKSLDQLAEQFGDTRIPSRIDRMCKVMRKQPYT